MKEKKEHNTCSMALPLVVFFLREKKVISQKSRETEYYLSTDREKRLQVQLLISY